MKEITLMCLVASLMVIDIGCKKEDSKLTPQPISKEKSSSISQNQPTKSLHRAAAEGDIKQVELQLANGAYINATDVSGSTPLHLAVSHGHNNIVELLIAKGVDIDATDNRSNIPLHCAARGGYTSLAELLIAKGADVNARNYIGATPLYLAATYGHKDMVEFLISHVSDVNIKTYGNITPLSSAEKQGHTEIVDLLQEHGAKLEKEPSVDGQSEKHKIVEESLQKAAENNELNGVLHLASVYATLLDKFDVAARTFISQNRNVTTHVFLNAVDRTAEGLRVYREGTMDKWGVRIPKEMLDVAEIDLGKYDGSVFSRKYADALDRGMSGFGYIQSKRLSTRQVTLLAKQFLEEWKEFPKDAKLITQGWYKGFFVTADGDLLVPGFSFYANVDDGSISTTTFKMVDSYSPKGPVADHPPASQSQPPKESEDTGGQSQRYKSERGRYTLPLPGGVELWEKSISPAQEVFLSKAKKGERIEIRWVGTNVGLSDFFGFAKGTAHLHEDGSVFGWKSIKWRQGQEAASRISGKQAIRFYYETDSNDLKLFVSGVAVKSGEGAFVIQAISPEGYERADKLFEDSCENLQFTN